MASLLELNDLGCARAGRRLFQGLTMALQAGELLVVRGANGSGKTSLLRLICGLLSPDRGEVIKRAQGLKAGGTNFFNDLLSLEPGEEWEKRLYEEIDRCDVFYLFWSSRAKASEWVMKEIEYALARRAASSMATPTSFP